MFTNYSNFIEYFGLFGHFVDLFGLFSHFVELLGLVSTCQTCANIQHVPRFPCTPRIPLSWHPKFNTHHITPDGPQNLWHNHTSVGHTGHSHNVSISGNISKNGNINISIFGNINKNGNVSSKKKRGMKSPFSVRDIDILVGMIAW